MESREEIRLAAVAFGKALSEGGKRYSVLVEHFEIFDRGTNSYRLGYSVEVDEILDPVRIAP